MPNFPRNTLLLDVGWGREWTLTHDRTAFPSGIFAKEVPFYLSRSTLLMTNQIRVSNYWILVRVKRLSRNV